MCYIKWGVIRNYKDSRNYAVKRKKNGCILLFNGITVCVARDC